jgi:hypothetical protein
LAWFTADAEVTVMTAGTAAILRHGTGARQTYRRKL